MLIRYSADENGRPVKKAVIYTKNEHKIQLSKIDPDALYILERLKDSGFSSYIVGGAVRDLILDRTPKDFDIVTDATPSRIKKIFRNSRIIGRRFRLVHVFFEDKIFEVSTFRSIIDGSVGNSFGTMDEDVKRRDFSLNALYYDPFTEHVIDYVNGVRDIKKHIIRPVIKIDRIFVEDPVRMIRAIKYSAATGCRLPFSLKRKILKSAHLLSSVSPSRLTEELQKIIGSGHSFEIVSKALQTDLYMYLQPSATAIMYARPDFEKKYLQSLKKLDETIARDADIRLGRKLFYLIYDFIYELTDWKKEADLHPSASELYALTWTECRNFVLPMNPQRTELEFAIKEVLKTLGISMQPPKKRKQKKTSAQITPNRR
ncbi:polynucleotide adenylyltransferase PcnB [Treponema parvum]|uniref:Polynucleotide adenylyltransferase PcnB n=1 Tax=Treponema parvum TaxID=138851 RepID=A0A975IEG5_9SPIR|nr:polynucleotide adenylyltransferase PcnB [Treponema parvum]QTQ14025.1 polynucleotide adenylyltransferase PcnB [Treponema parvum]